jgi:hypothetical protein
MATADDGRIEPFLDRYTGAGFDRGLAPHYRRAMSLLVEIAANPSNLLGRKQDRLGDRVRQPEPFAASQHLFNRDTPVMGESFYTLARHRNYLISALRRYPAESRINSAILKRSAGAIAPRKERNSRTRLRMNLCRQFCSRCK